MKLTIEIEKYNTENYVPPFLLIKTVYRASKFI